MSSRHVSKQECWIQSLEPNALTVIAHVRDRRRIRLCVCMSRVLEAGNGFAADVCWSQTVEPTNSTKDVPAKERGRSAHAARLVVVFL